MTKQTKKLSAQATVSTVSAGQKIPMTDANGNVTLITPDNLKTAMIGSINLNAIEDGIFIMFHRKSDDFPLMVKPHKWAGYQSSGEVAEGVVVVEGGKCLVVAPTESTTGLLWSSAAVSGGGFTTTDRVAAIADWSGKANTAAQIAASTSGAVTNTASYAPGFCNLYSRVNANGKGLTAGKWWLPSIGEMMLIYANMLKINYALSLISGATQLVENWYWTSTEAGSSTAWGLSLTVGNLGDWFVKATDSGHVRAVSAFIS